MASRNSLAFAKKISWSNRKMTSPGNVSSPGDARRLGSGSPRRLRGRLAQEPEHGRVRPEAAVDQRDERREHRDDEALEHTEEEDPDEADGGEREVGVVEALQPSAAPRCA